MGTLLSVVNKVRIRIREKSTQYFTDDDFISLANDSLTEFYKALANIECKLVSDTATFTISESTSDYAIADKKFVVNGYVFIDDAQITPYDAQYPGILSYEDTATGITLHNHTTGELCVHYWKNLTELASLSDEIPFEGLWDDALMRTLVMECKEIRKHRANNTAMLASSAVAYAMAESIEKYGTFNRQIRSSLNV